MRTIPAVIGLALAAASVSRAAGLPDLKFRAVDVDTAVEIGYGLAIGEVDGDGKPDIILADKRTVQWYRNPDWSKHVIAGNLTPNDNVCVAAKDLDGDGRVEIAVGAGWNPADTVNSGAVFYLVPPGDRTQKWTPVALPHEPTVHRMHWVEDAAGRNELIVKPLHGRGNQNGEGAGARVLAYRMPADAKQEWTTSPVSDFSHLAHNFHPVNWDRNRGQQLLCACKEGIWFLAREGEKWTRTQYTGHAAGEVRDGVLGSGGRFVAAIEPMHGTTVAVYAQPAEAGTLWPRVVLDETLKEGHALAVADVLGTGTPQLLAGWRGKPSGIRLYTPLDAEGRAWRTTQIAGAEIAVEDMKVADLNADGKPDIIAAGRATKNLRILFNECPKP